MISRVIISPRMRQTPSKILALIASAFVHSTLIETLRLFVVTLKADLNGSSAKQNTLSPSEVADASAQEKNEIEFPLSLFPRAFNVINGTIFQVTTQSNFGQEDGEASWRCGDVSSSRFLESSKKTRNF